jgi:hypothetical protein
MMAKLVGMYRKGAITADHLVVESLHMVDPANPSLVLSALPPDILHRVLEFTHQYDHHRMVTNYGALPAADQVAAARGWIESNGRS